MSAEPFLAPSEKRGNRKRGRLKVFLGYAAGSGKTYQMLDEGQGLRQRGADVVIGYFEPHGRKDTIAKTEGLETIPRQKIPYRDSIFEEMNLDAIFIRHPEICLVDELAHTNVPGAGREKRWQDVQALLETGIDVWTTMNVQHLESLNDQIQQITGVRVRETVPDWVVNDAEEVVLVDITPRALRNRLQRGVVYAPEKAAQAMENFFTEANLNALRELALRQAALEVEDRLEHRGDATPESDLGRISSPFLSATGKHKEKIMICLSGNPSSENLIRRGKRIADHLQADSIVVYVLPSPDGQGVSPEEKKRVEDQLKLAESLHMGTQVLTGKDIAHVLVRFARQQNVSQMLLGRSSHRAWQRILHGNIIDGVVCLAPDIQITIVAR